MPLTNTNAQTVITEHMTKIVNDKTMTLAVKAKLLALLNNSMVRNSHVQLRAMRLVSTVTARKQTKLVAPQGLLQMPILKV